MCLALVVVVLPLMLLITGPAMIRLLIRKN